jgi:hypothetical protein
LAEEGDVKGFSHAFVTFARAKPMNAAFVAEAPLQRFSTAICLSVSSSTWMLGLASISITKNKGEYYMPIRLIFHGPTLKTPIITSSSSQPDN